MEPNADDQFDGFETAKPPPFTPEELQRLAASRSIKALGSSSCGAETSAFQAEEEARPSVAI